MFLLFDLSEKDRIRLALFNKTRTIEHAVEGRNRDLLLIVHDFLQKEGLAHTDAEGIMVVVGEGSFTSTRIGITVANTFAYVHQIPLLAISKGQSANPAASIDELLKQSRGQYVSATYSGEANIGKSRRQSESASDE